MEDKKTEWKNFIILKQGPFWVVRNGKRFVGGKFTSQHEAERYINRRKEAYKRTLLISARRKVLKMPIRLRKKEYDRLCQIVESI